MDHFYDGQIRRYLTQLIRMMSGFTYADGSGQLTTVPAMYGDITRQVGSILRDNSENKIPSAPRMGVYITGLEMDRNRTSDSSYVNKVNIRERAYNADGQEYLNHEGRNYTVERLMPTPYTLTINVDIWTSNTEQKLQLMEQILMLFNPSLELQTTDNYLDWTSLSVVNLDTVNWSSRSIPTGTDSEIDVGTLTFSTPIYISPPAKVKRLGVVTDILTKVFQEIPQTDILPEANLRTGIYVSPTGEIKRERTEQSWTQSLTQLNVNKSAYQDCELLVLNTTAKLIKRGIVGGMSWDEFVKGFPSKFEDGVTTIRLSRSDFEYDIIGRIAISPISNTEVTVDWDIDSLPTDTVISSSQGNRSKIDAIIDPTKSDPRTLQSVSMSDNPRILLLAPIGSSINTDGADAWKNNDGTDFVADANDIVEWDGAKWSVVFDADTDVSVYGTVYTTNLNTGVQYKFDSGEWILSFEGEYPNGAWKIEF